MIIEGLFFSELTKGKFTNSTRSKFETIINKIKNNGAEGIILGCTELPILLSKKQYNIPLFDALNLHAFSAVDEALK